MCASLRVTETQRHNESKGCLVAELRSVVFGQQHHQTNLFHSKKGLSMSTSVGTRKMVNYYVCLSRVKPEETLVKACSDSDLQIDHQTWV